MSDLSARKRANTRQMSSHQLAKKMKEYDVKGVATGPFVNVGRQELIETPLVSSYALPENKKEYKMPLHVNMGRHEMIESKLVFPYAHHENKDYNEAIPSHANVRNYKHIESKLMRTNSISDKDKNMKKKKGDKEEKRKKDDNIDTGRRSQALFARSHLDKEEDSSTFIPRSHMPKELLTTDLGVICDDAVPRAMFFEDVVDEDDDEVSSYVRESNDSDEFDAVQSDVEAVACETEDVVNARGPDQWRGHHAFSSCVKQQSAMPSQPRENGLEEESDHNEEDEKEEDEEMDDDLEEKPNKCAQGEAEKKFDFEYTLETPLINLLDWDGLYMFGGGPELRAKTDEIICSAEKRRLLFVSRLFIGHPLTVIMTKETFARVLDRKPRTDGVLAKFVEFHSGAAANKEKALVIDGSHRLMAVKRMVAARENAYARNPEGSLRELVEGLMVVVRVQTCPPKWEMNFEATLREQDTRIRRPLSQFACWMMARVEEIDLEYGAHASTTFVEMVHRCRGLYKKNVAEFSTFDRVRNTGMLPKKVGKRRGGGLSAWRGAFRICKEGNEQLTQFIINSFSDSRMVEVMMHQQASSTVAGAFGRNPTIVRTFFEGFVGMDPKAVHTTNLNKMVDALSDVHGKSQKLRRVAKKENGIESEWLIGPDGLSGVCEGLQHVTGNLGMLKQLTEEKFDHECKEADACEDLDKLRVLASYAFVEFGNGPKTQIVMKSDTMMALFTRQKDAIASRIWIRAFLFFGGIVLVVDDTTTTWSNELMRHLRKFASIRKCMLRSSTDEGPHYVLLAANRSCASADTPATVERRPKTIIDNLKNIGITNSTKCFVVTFPPN